MALFFDLAHQWRDGIICKIVRDSETPDNRGGLETQGNRVKQSSGEETCEEVVVPCCDLSLESE